MAAWRCKASEAACCPPPAVAAGLLLCTGEHIPADLEPLSSVFCTDM